MIPRTFLKVLAFCFLLYMGPDYVEFTIVIDTTVIRLKLIDIYAICGAISQGVKRDRVNLSETTILEYSRLSQTTFQDYLQSIGTWVIPCQTTRKKLHCQKKVFFDL